MKRSLERRRGERSPSYSGSGSRSGSRSGSSSGSGSSYSYSSSSSSSSDSDNDYEDIPRHIQNDFIESKRRIERIMTKKPRHNIIRHNDDDDPDGEGEKYKIYVGNLSPSLSESDLRMVFSSFGKVHSVDLKQGYCFIRFVSKDSSNLIMSSNLKIKLHGQVLKIGWARKDTAGGGGNNNSSATTNDSGGGHHDSTNECDPNITLRQKWGLQPGYRLYVGNLSPSVTEVDLISLFRAYGEVRFCFLCTKDKYGRYGFVELSSRKCADDAIEGLNGCKFKGRDLKIMDTKDEKKPIPTNVHVVFGFECEEEIARMCELDNVIYLRGEGGDDFGKKCADEKFVEELKSMCSSYGIVKDFALVNNSKGSPVIKVVFKTFKRCKIIA